MSVFGAASHYYSGQGVVMIGSRDPNTGLPLGMLPVGNVTMLKIDIATTVIEHKEAQTGQRAIDLRLVTETKCNLSMMLDNFNANNLATALRGGATYFTSGTVTAEPITAFKGFVTGFNHVSVSSVVVHQGATVLTAYVADGTNWDYKLNADAGSIMLNDGVATPVAGLVGSAGAPLSLTVDYSYATQTQTDALTTGVQERYLRFEGLNTADANSPVVVEVFKFSIDPLKELQLLSDTIQTYQLDGSVLADQLRTSGSKFFRERALR